MFKLLRNTVHGASRASTLHGSVTHSCALLCSLKRGPHSLFLFLQALRYFAWMRSFISGLLKGSRQSGWQAAFITGNPLEEGMATHSSIPAWRIPWTEEPGRLQSMGSQRVVHNWSDFTHTHTHPHTHTPTHLAVEFATIAQRQGDREEADWCRTYLWYVKLKKNLEFPW